MANPLSRLCLKKEIFVKVDCVRNKARKRAATTQKRVFGFTPQEDVLAPMGRLPV
ncbi:hypothetical protein Mic7113_4109 [Allocoleopsis franciscana PCC 7113]|uniref:Uncharacterized protein n=1 Tax=Allocoleopsis franciscana PCC 7113 TaxID=1173027 RepID=K9WJ24_9CYAN|nr:hypothetical protein Mic7113_4109 [Allocoleopsis franciscana PCC 7113]